MRLVQRRQRAEGDAADAFVGEHAGEAALDPALEEVVFRLMDEAGGAELAEELGGAGGLFGKRFDFVGDDGEKFGAWPHTHRTCYEEGWLTRFFDLLGENASWIELALPGEVIDSAPPLGKIYLPDASYREMTEWALPVSQQIEYDHLVHELEHDGRWPRIKKFFQGGFWRNFKVKYPEANEMYARMMAVSRRVASCGTSLATNQRCVSPRARVPGKSDAVCASAPMPRKKS